MPAPLKVLHICHSLHTGGLERIVVEMVRRGPEHGFTSQVATLSPGGELAALVEKLGGRWCSLDKRAGLDWRLVGRIRKLARRMDADLLHAHNEGAGLYAGLAGRLGGRPVLCTRHGLSFGAGSRGAWLRRAAGWLCRRTVCVGRDVLRLAREKDHLPASRLALIPNGVDCEVFAPDPAARDRLRSELGVEPGQPVVISVGRLAPEKDYGLLLAAMAVMEKGGRAAGAQALLLLVGQGPERPGLEKLAGELGLGSRVRFLGDRRDVPALLNAADVFALSSLSEGVPMALLEAMSCGLPVAATAVGGVPEVVEHGRNGLLVHRREAADLAQALSQLLDEPDRARELGRAARERVLEHFSLEAMLGAYAALYRGLAGKGA